jgi:hypothetical protein
VSAAVVDGPASVAEGRRDAAEIEGRRADLRRVAGRLTTGDSNTSFEAYYDGNALRHVAETTGYGSPGKGRRRYYLDSTGVLFYYHAEDERGVTQAGGQQPDGSSIHIVFDSAGNVRASEKRLNGRPTELLDSDVRGALARLGALRQAAEAGAQPR